MEKEAAIVLMEAAVLCPDPVLILVFPPCYSLVRTQVVLCLSHAQDCPHLSPNNLSLVLPLLHLEISMVSEQKTFVTHIRAP